MYVYVSVSVCVLLGCKVLEDVVKAGTIRINKYVCVCVRACERACVRASVPACVRA